MGVIFLNGIIFCYAQFKRHIIKRLSISCSRQLIKLFLEIIVCCKDESIIHLILSGDIPVSIYAQLHNDVGHRGLHQRFPIFFDQQKSFFILRNNAAVEIDAVLLGTVFNIGGISESVRRVIVSRISITGICRHFFKIVSINSRCLPAGTGIDCSLREIDVFDRPDFISFHGNNLAVVVGQLPAVLIVHPVNFCGKIRILRIGGRDAVAAVADHNARQAVGQPLGPAAVTISHILIDPERSTGAKVLVRLSRAGDLHVFILVIQVHKNNAATNPGVETRLQLNLGAFLNLQGSQRPARAVHQFDSDELCVIHIRVV